MRNKNIFDAIIIGAGMSGEWVAREFCEKEWNTLVPERGRNGQPFKDYLTTSIMPWAFSHRNQSSFNASHFHPVTSRCHVFQKDIWHFFVKDVVGIWILSFECWVLIFAFCLLIFQLM